VRLYTLHAGDCCIDKGRVFTPGIEMAKESAEKLKRIPAETNATMLYGHDVAQWKTLRRAPHYYD
jgi:hypothetical protein